MLTHIKGFVKQELPEGLMPSMIIFTDRFEGLPELARSVFPELGLGFRATCVVHLLRNVKDACGRNMSDSHFWAVQSAENEEKLAEAWDKLTISSPKHAAYLRAVPPEEWITLRLIAASHAPTFGIRSSNDPESLHAAQAVARELAPIDCLVELLTQDASRLYKVQKATDKALNDSRKKLKILTSYHAMFEEFVKVSGEYILGSQTSPFSGSVHHGSKNPLHSATVDLSNPERVTCSRCFVSEKVRAM